MTKAWRIRMATTAVGVLVVVAGVYFCFRDRSDATVQPAFLPPELPAEATFKQVQEFCVACHSYPPPDSFPRANWRKEVEQGFYFAGRFRPDLRSPSLESVVAYYESRAPIELPLPSRPVAKSKSSITWRSRGHAIPNQEPFPVVVNVAPARLTPGGELQIIVCECDPLKDEGRVLLFNPNTSPPTWKELAKLPSPVHAEVVDLDGDGRPDILVACIGKFFPTDEKVGSVVWLRGKGDESFQPVTLLSGVGRVADVQAADFKGDGKLDLVVAEFGWREIGSILLLENRTTDWSKPQFDTRVLDDRHGAINICIGDLNGDGAPDFVTVISQEHETVVAFLNDGKGHFRKETIYTAPHPAYGSSGIQLVDLDGDGNLDVLYTNGDVMDKPFLLKPYHGIHWLENRGRFPFVHHRLADMPGVMRAVAADFRGSGKLDILAVSYLPAEEFLRRDELDLDAVLWLEQTTKGVFVRRPLETKTCDHFTCAVANLKGNGLPSLVVGNFWSTRQRPLRDAITIWSPLQDLAK
jgi:FG-GAP-like repeat